MNPEQKEMRKIAEIEPHNRYMQIRLTEAEYEAIERKFRNSGLRSRSEFIRAMIFEGYFQQHQSDSRESEQHEQSVYRRHREHQGGAG